MAIGGQQSRSTEDDALQQIARAMEHAMLLVDQHADANGNLVAADFQAAPYSYTAGEAADAVALIADMVLLRQIYRGNATQATTKNFRNSVKKALGAGFY